MILTEWWSVMANLIVVVTEPETGERSGFAFARHPFADERAVTVGRSKECDIQLADAMVSRLHARISLTPDGEILVRDLDSSNGTIAGDRTLRGEQLTIDSGSRIEVGPYVIVAAYEVAGGQPTAEETMHGSSSEFRGGERRSA